MGDAEKTEDALRRVLGEGADPVEILAGAKAYAAEQADNQNGYIKYSENWIEEKRWPQHVSKPGAAVDPQVISGARPAGRWCICAIWHWMAGRAGLPCRSPLRAFATMFIWTSLGCRRFALAIQRA